MPFTPGPWSFHNDLLYVYDAKNVIIANLPGGQIENLRADARLIATSPDLLAALKRYIEDDCPYVCDADSCECGPNGDGTEKDGNICPHRQACAAISKAEGKKYSR